MTATAKQVTQNPVPSLEAIEGSHTPQDCVRSAPCWVMSAIHRSMYMPYSERERTIFMLRCWP